MLIYMCAFVLGVRAGRKPMHPIKDYQYPPENREIAGFNSGFSLAVVIILVFAALIIGGLVISFQKTTDAANARLVYLAATAKAIEYEASGHYRVPVQADLAELIGEEVNRDAVIEVVDANGDAAIDYIVYTRGGLVTRYMPGKTEIATENKQD